MGVGWSNYRREGRGEPCVRPPSYNAREKKSSYERIVAENVQRGYLIHSGTFSSRHPQRRSQGASSWSLRSLGRDTSPFLSQRPSWLGRSAQRTHQLSYTGTHARTASRTRRVGEREPKRKREVEKEENKSDSATRTVLLLRSRRRKKRKIK